MGGCGVIREHRAERRVARGDRYLAEADYDAALAEFQDAIQFNPRLAYAHSRIGSIHRQRGEYE